MEISLVNLPLVRGALKKADKTAKNEGIVSVMRMIVKAAGDRLTVKNKTKELKKVLKNEAVLIISNHIAQADVPILLSVLEPRNDAFLVASHHFLNILPNVDKNIIPVYISHREFENNDWKFRLLNRIHRVEIHHPDKAHQKNIESINEATEKINKGGLVVIFPSAKEIGFQFKAGVGYMIKNLINPKKVKIVMAYIEGTSSWDYLRLIPYLGRLLPKVRIAFSKVITAKEFWDEDAKKSAKKLEKAYYKWTESI